jgi:uncharacterized protein (TIGR03905 family)
MAKVSYQTHGVCSKQINVEVEDGIVKSVQFIGGCNGNTKGVAKLAVGRSAEELIEILKDTDCNGRGTSCPAQLALALKAALEQE